MLSVRRFDGRRGAFRVSSVFRNPDAVREQLALPAVIAYSFIGLPTPEYHARLEAIVVRIAGETNVRKRSFNPSSGGKYTAYRFEVYHDDFEAVEAIYREVRGLEGTKFVV